MSEKINVNIIRELWCSNDSNFIIYLGELLPDNNIITVSVTNFMLRPGKTTLVGNWVNYKGKPTFKSVYEEIDVNSKEYQHNILCSIKGIKDVTAAKILSLIPEHENLEYLVDNDIKISKKHLHNIRLALRELNNNKTRKELIQIFGNTISSKKLNDLHSYLVDNNINVSQFKTDPYESCMELNFGFKFVDKIALDTLKVNEYLDSRVMYLSEYIVKNLLNKNGSTYIDYSKFQSAMFDLDIDIEKYNDLFVSDISRIVIFDYEGKKVVQSKLLHEAENNIPKILDSYKTIGKDYGTWYDYLEEQIKDFEKLENIELHESQKLAVVNSIQNGMSSIIGGAGTGKSTIVKCVLYVLKRQDETAILLAPTGKAARRLSEATCQAAYTCHSFYLREENTYAEKPWFNHYKNTLIIDEFSMVDTILFYNVLKAINQSRMYFNRIILVGDENQLPSVGAGKVLTDIINYNKYKIIRLNYTFRQNEDSNILSIANRVKNNKAIEYVRSKDFFMKFTNDYINYAVRLFCNRLEYYKYDLDLCYGEFQLCSSTNIFTNSINETISEYLESSKLTIPFKIGNKILDFGLNDKVMCIVNDYDNDISNGEFGRIQELKYTSNNEDIYLDNVNDIKRFYESDIKYKDLKFIIYYPNLNKCVEYDLCFDEISKFKLAYCCTIHKLQGSEYNTVACVLNMNLITDNRLLYTAITRAKKLFVLITDSLETVNKIIRNKYSQKRDSLLFLNKEEN